MNQNCKMHKNYYILVIVWMMSVFQSFNNNNNNVAGVNVEWMNIRYVWNSRSLFLIARKNCNENDKKIHSVKRNNKGIVRQN